MQIPVYDSNDNNKEYLLNISGVDNGLYNDVFAEGATTFERDGRVWNVTPTDNDQNRIIQISGPGYINSVDEINALINLAGLNAGLTGSDSLEDLIETGTDNLYFNKSDGTQGYPAFSYQKSVFVGDRYINRIEVLPSHGTSYTSDYFTDPAQGDSFSLGKIVYFDQGDNLVQYGAIMVSSVDYPTPSTTITFVRNSSITNTTYAKNEPSPGDEGFKPIGRHPKKPSGGGGRPGGKPDYPSDEIPLPDEPDESKASAVKSGFIKAYDVVESDLQHLGQCLTSDTFIDAIVNTSMKPYDYIISLNVMPYTPHIGSLTYIKLGKMVCRPSAPGVTDPTAIGIEAKGFPLTQQFRKISFGSINVAEMFQSYLDYTSTTMTLYLPFIGEVDIDITEVMGGSISLDYILDFFTGTCVANVKCTKVNELSDGYKATSYTYHSFQGNCASQIPITSISYGNLVAGIISAASMGLKGNVAGGVASFVGDSLSGNLAPTVQTKGTIGANAGYCSVLYPFITITRPITAEPESFQEVMGYPSYMDTTLGTCSGLCVCDNINLQGLTGATDNEINKIKQICKEGIYI